MKTVCDYILNIDEQLLLFVNNLHSPPGDIMMHLFSGNLFWLPLYIFLIYFLIKRIGVVKGIIGLVLLTLLIASVDQIGASVLRPIFCRLRPSSPLNPISQVLHFVNDARGGDYGFPSCHAANTFAVATFLTCTLKSSRMRSLLFSWAVLVSVSRIYLGFHYPTDILAGAFLGITMGLTFSYIFSLISLFLSKSLSLQKTLPKSVSLPKSPLKSYKLPSIKFPVIKFPAFSFFRRLDPNP